MSFKTHLIFVTLVIACVFLFWRLSQPAIEPIVAQPVQKSDFGISVAYATWGRNCLNSGNVSIDNNVKEEVSASCNGLMECKIIADSRTFRNDFNPQCSTKELEVEYRCFSFDRLRSVKSAMGSLIIKCDASNMEEKTPK